ncbi:hypothetical protein [Streptomyces sp. NPDC005969]|uniref:hypothetical protein n=1 Tax=Streptomyces sp. NPDC005969 TaxID=3156722 RepID=UPI0033EEBF71
MIDIGCSSESRQNHAREAPVMEERDALSGFRFRIYRKSATMAEFLAAVAMKIAVALAEAIILRLVWELWATCSRSIRTGFVVPAAV